MRTPIEAVRSISETFSEERALASSFSHLVGEIKALCGYEILGRISAFTLDQEKFADTPIVFQKGKLSVCATATKDNTHTLAVLDQNGHTGFTFYLRGQHMEFFDVGRGLIAPSRDGGYVSNKTRLELGEKSATEIKTALEKQKKAAA